MLNNYEIGNKLDTEEMREIVAGFIDRSPNNVVDILEVLSENCQEKADDLRTSAENEDIVNGWEELAEVIENARDEGDRIIGDIYEA